jgi:hypothetical protein
MAVEGLSPTVNSQLAANDAASDARMLQSLVLSEEMAKQSHKTAMGKIVNDGRSDRDGTVRQIKM